MSSTFEEGCMYEYENTSINFEGNLVKEIQLLCFFELCESFPDLHGSSGPVAVFNTSEGKRVGFGPFEFYSFKRAFHSNK